MKIFYYSYSKIKINIHFAITKGDCLFTHIVDT